MKKSLKNKIIRTTSLIAISFFLFSCGSAPKAEAVPVEPEETVAAVEEAPAEETPAEMAEEEKEVEPQTAVEEEQPEEIKEEPVEDPLPELIEDIPGYYESDPKPVFLQPSENLAKTEENTEQTDSPAVEEKKEEETKASETTVELKEEKTETVEADKKETAAESTKVEIAQQKTPAEPEKEKVAVVPTPAPEKKPAPVVLAAVEVAGIAAAEEVESSELLSESNEPEENEKPSENNPENKIVIVPSRAVEMKNNQYLDIVYPGTGWIYLGEEDNKTTMRYFGRKIGERNTVFSLRSREEGNTILHFYKNDQLTGKFIDDYLQVEIKGTNNSPEHAVAPSYAEAVPPKPEKKILTQQKPAEVRETEKQNSESFRETTSKTADANAAKTQRPVAKTPVKTSPAKPAAAKTEAKKSPSPAPVVSSAEDPSDNGTKTVIQQKTSDGEHKSAPKSENSYAQEIQAPEKTVPTVSKNSIQNTENMAADEILEKAKESFKNKKYEDTLAYLDDFFAKATTKIDEGLMLQGQTFESNSSVRNIKSALDTYETIVRRYPQSIHWPKANERITYLRKFYFNIR